MFLGRLAFEQVHRHDRYKIRLADIECVPPDGMSRVDFLDEVQYLANLPAELRLLDDELPEQLAGAFARHPWVMSVNRVQVLPGNRLHVELKYRRPVLAVMWDGQLRAVDAGGVLLPENAAAAGLPLFTGRARPPQGPVGVSWGDPAVLAAAQKAAHE